MNRLLNRLRWLAAPALLTLGVIACSTNGEETTAQSDSLTTTTPAAAEGAKCGSDRDCASTQFCDNVSVYLESVCRNKRDVGQFCWSERECKSNACDDGKCIDSPTCRPLGNTCRNDDDCCSGMYCNIEFLGYGNSSYGGYGVWRACTKKGAIGDACSRDSECVSNNCDQYQCKAAE